MNKVTGAKDKAQAVMGKAADVAAKQVKRKVKKQAGGAASVFLLILKVSTDIGKWGGADGAADWSLGFYCFCLGCFGEILLIRGWMSS
jgi:hypothetical protein